MKIVIDIDEDTYKDIKKGKVYSSMRDVPQESVLAIANGTPLPKGHGRLIDADAIEYTHAVARSLDDGYNWNELCITENELYDAPTIIEADRGE